MSENIAYLFRQASDMDQTNRSAFEIYQQIVASLFDKPNTLSLMELQILILSAEKVFLYSGASDIQYAMYIIHLCETYFEHVPDDPEICEVYVLMLELTHQYEQSWDFLKTCLSHDTTKKLALTFLSSYTYCAEGMQSFTSCIEYKKELIAMSTDMQEKEKLQSELRTMLEIHK